MINIVVDRGNSKIKLGIFDSYNLIESHLFHSLDEIRSVLAKPHNNIIVSSVKEDMTEILNSSVASNFKVVLNHQLPIPINIKYSTPLTLGVDRIADACGALQIYPDTNCLVIDLGTCINYEFVDAERNYWGGIISPGMKMRFKAMNTFTARLPLVDEIMNPELIGRSTTECMQSGVVNGMIAEMNEFITQMRAKYTNLKVLMTGGDAQFFENQLKHSIFAAPELVLVGLNRILMHNVSN